MNTGYLLWRRKVDSDRETRTKEEAAGSITSPCPEQGRLGAKLLGTRNSYRCPVPLLLL